MGENGAFYIRYPGPGKCRIRRYTDAPEVRANRSQRRAVIGEAILSAIRGAAPAPDQPYREASRAIDICEQVPPLPISNVAEIMRQFEALGATASVGPMHGTAWFGHHNKLTMTRWLMLVEYSVDLARMPEAYLFIGFSLSDAGIFTLRGRASARRRSDGAQRMP